MKNNRCEALIRFNKTVSRCVCKAGHAGDHYYPNMVCKLDDPERWQSLQARKTPYNITIGELKFFCVDNHSDNPPQTEEK